MKWRALQPGDIVDVVAPGFRCSDENLEKGVAFLKRLGLTPRVPDDLFGDDILCSNNDNYRFNHLKQALEARDSKAVWCVRAGYGAIRFIEKLKKIKKPKQSKLFIGYSDATTINTYLTQFWNWPVLHGPLLDRLGANENVSAEEVAELQTVIFGEKTEVLFDELTALNKAAERVKTVKGRIFGGNLTVFQTLLGTPYQKFKDDILFLEDIGERGYRIDRMLKHLEHAGVFKKVKAILFGTFTGGQERDGRNLVAPVLKRFADEQKVPVLLGLNAGHGDYQRPLFLHTPAVLRPSMGELLVQSQVQLNGRR